MRVLKLYQGLGDSCYLNPIVAKFVAKHRDEPVLIETPFPQFFGHLGDNIRFIRPNMHWRTQSKMMKRIPDDLWVKELPKEILIPKPRPVPQPGFPMNHQDWRPFDYSAIKPGILTTFYYNGDTLSRKNIIQGFEAQAGIQLPEPLTFPMPTFGPLPFEVPAGKKVAVIRPPTDRAEWHTPARQCDPQYTNKAAKMLKEAGYFVVSVADVEDKKEWLVGEPPEADLTFHRGELGVDELMALVEHCDLLVGGIGWIVPAGMAYNCNLFMIFGGRGGYDNYGNITDARVDLSRVGYALPRNFCACTISTHLCNKHIDGFEQTFGKYLARVDRLPPRELTKRHDARSYHSQSANPVQIESTRTPVTTTTDPNWRNIVSANIPRIRQV